MSRRFFLVLLSAALSAVLCPSNVLWAQRSVMISETVAAEHGLSRPWFTQVQLDETRGHLQDLVLYEGTLYAQTDKAIIHAIDAETGKTLWWKQVGEPRHPSMTPGADRDWLAVVNGTRLYVLNRFNGDLLYRKDLSETPGAGAALSAQRVYVPLRSGLIVAYRLEPPIDPAQEDKMDLPSAEPPMSETERREKLQLRADLYDPLFCQSYGHARVQPLVTRESAREEYVVWPTDRGLLNVARIKRPAGNLMALEYRLETGATIVGRPAYLPPNPKVPGDSGLIVAVSRDGFVYTIQEKSGELLWRFSIGEPIVESPAVFEDRVYVSAQLGGMYCLAIKTREDLWFAPDIVQFVAASKTKVYTADRLGRLVVLNAQNGVRLNVISTVNMPIRLLNTQTDRIYLADKRGLIQCLHEVGQTEPIVYGKDRKQAEETPTVEPKGTGEAQKPAKKEPGVP